jgi:hypothetical protein
MTWTVRFRNFTNNVAIPDHFWVFYCVSCADYSFIVRHIICASIPTVPIEYIQCACLDGILSACSTVVYSVTFLLISKQKIPDCLPSSALEQCLCDQSHFPVRLKPVLHSLWDLLHTLRHVSLPLAFRLGFTLIHRFLFLTPQLHMSYVPKENLSYTCSNCPHWSSNSQTCWVQFDIFKILS